MDKVTRGKVHQIVRVRYKKLESDTLVEDDVRFIRISVKGAGGHWGSGQVLLIFQEKGPETLRQISVIYHVYACTI